MFLLHSRVCISFTPNIYLSFYLNLGCYYPFWKYSDMGFSITSKFALTEPNYFFGFGHALFIFSLNVSQCLLSVYLTVFEVLLIFMIFSLGPWQTRWICKAIMYVGPKSGSSQIYESYTHIHNHMPVCIYTKKVVFFH